MDHVLLLVEDDDADALLVGRAIRKAQVNVRLHRVKDGEEAIEYLGGHREYADRAAYPPASVVLLDIKLPRRDGFEVVTWLRRQPRPLSRTAVVMFTSSGRPVDVNRAYELGANSYLRKPDQHSELVATISTFNDFWLSRCALPETGSGPTTDDA
jgi:CheY-like chemotaxis protein